MDFLKNIPNIDLWSYLSTTDKAVVMYGMGNGADKILSVCERYGIEIADFFASDGFVRGHSFHGKKVLSFSEAREKYSDFIILVSFATKLPEVMTLISDIAGKYELYIPDMPVVGEEYFTSEFYNANYSDITKAYNSLSDELSKSLFSSIISYKLSAEINYLKQFTSTDDEMYELLNCDEIKNAVDAGAYNGDTAKEMIRYFPNLKSLYAFEPDPKNCKKLNKMAAEVDTCSFEIFENALWSCDDEAYFSSSKNRNSSLINSSFQHNDVKVNLVALDNIETKKLDYIKYDVEGVEAEALKGSLKKILSDRPSLLVSVYHKSEDVFLILNELSKKLTDYSFYLRRKACYPAWELNLYAIPKEKDKRISKNNC